jgi:hypothetical protein
MDEKGLLLHEEMCELVSYLKLHTNYSNFFNSAWYFAIQSDPNRIICSSSVAFMYNRYAGTVQSEYFVVNVLLL